MMSFMPGLLIAPVASLAECRRGGNPFEGASGGHRETALLSALSAVAAVLRSRNWKLDAPPGGAAVGCRGSGKRKIVQIRRIFGIRSTTAAPRSSMRFRNLGDAICPDDGGDGRHDHSPMPGAVSVPRSGTATSTPWAPSSGAGRNRQSRSDSILNIALYAPLGAFGVLSSSGGRGARGAGLSSRRSRRGAVVDSDPAGTVF